MRQYITFVRDAHGTYQPYLDNTNEAGEVSEASETDEKSGAVETSNGVNNNTVVIQSKLPRIALLSIGMLIPFIVMAVLICKHIKKTK